MTAVVEGITYTHGIAIDVERGRMYFSGLFGLYSANLDGSNVRLLDDQNQYFGIDISPDGQWIGWADPTEDRIGRIRIDGSDFEVLASTGMENPTGVAFAIPEPTVVLMSGLAGILLIRRSRNQNATKNGCEGSRARTGAIR